MTKYRIIEKKGEYKSAKELVGDKCLYETQYSSTKNIYIPRFIVQHEEYEAKNSFDPGHIPKLNWFDLKEFTDLEEARKYKRNLELDDGIVIE